MLRMSSKFEEQGGVSCMAQKRHWLDYDPVAVAVLVIGLGMIELLAMII
jgi:hypothetical protein